MRRRDFIGVVGGLAGSGLPAWPLMAQAQQPTPPAAAPAIKPAQAIAEFVTGFDLKNAPQIVIDRARVAFVDTVGVMLAEPSPDARK